MFILLTFLFDQVRFLQTILLIYMLNFSFIETLRVFKITILLNCYTIEHKLNILIAKLWTEIPIYLKYQSQLRSFQV